MKVSQTIFPGGVVRCTDTSFEIVPRAMLNCRDTVIYLFHKEALGHGVSKCLGASDTKRVRLPGDVPPDVRQLWLRQFQSKIGKRKNKLKILMSEQRF